MTKRQILDHYNSDAFLTEALVKKKEEAGLCRPHPEVPEIESAKQFLINSDCSKIRTEVRIARREIFFQGQADKETIQALADNGALDILSDSDDCLIVDAPAPKDKKHLKDHEDDNDDKNGKKKKKTKTRRTRRTRRARRTRRNKQTRWIYTYCVRTGCAWRSWCFSAS